MKKEELKNLINQVRKYDLAKEFDNPEEFDNWLKRLSVKQMQNFNSLTVEPELIQFPANLIINEDLLNCDDYANRIDAMIRLKNADGWWHLFDRLCSPNFLNSKNYYEDMELISKAPSIQHPLWIINKDTFINSKYHKEDLELIVNAKDIEREDGKRLDSLVEEALTVVAGDINSINSPYHQKDMQLIAISDSKCLQSAYSYPEHSLNNLAVNEISLKDKYHLENMQILSRRPELNKYLYKLMTNPGIISGKNYRDEINAVASAKSEITALAMYRYITNDEDLRDTFYLYDHNSLDINDTNLIRRDNNIRGEHNPNYLKYLQVLNEMDDKYVLFFESLMSNRIFSNSKYQVYDIELLRSIADKDIFVDLYRVMSDGTSLLSNHHTEDLEIIKNTESKKLRNLLIEKAINRDSLESCYHTYDMKYISKLDMDKIDEDSFQDMNHYLFDINGINHPEHIERLEMVLKGKNVKNYDAILNHLDNLENSIDTDIDIDIDKTNNSGKVLSKIRQIFKKK